MRYIKLWGELNAMYEQTSRGRLLRRSGHARLFYGCMLVYAAVSIGGLFMKDGHFFLSVVSIFLTAMLISFLFLRALSKDYPSCLSAYPLLGRGKFIRYIEFKKRFDNSADLTPELIPSLLEWDETKNKTLDTWGLFTNPLTLVAISAFLAKLFESLGPAHENLEFWIVTAYLFMATMFISWVAYDFLSSARKRNFEICRLLRWIHIESKTPAELRESSPSILEVGISGESVEIGVR